MNFSRYVGHVYYLAECVMLFSRKVRVTVRIRNRIRFSVWLVGGNTHVLILLSVVIVTLPVLASTAEARLNVVLHIVVVLLLLLLLACE